MKSKRALEEIEKEGVNNIEAVTIFKAKIGQLIKKLEEFKEDPKGKIASEIDMLNDNIILVDYLVDFNKNPTLEKANYLRGVALSNSRILKFVQNEMNKQENPQFRFLK